MTGGTEYTTAVLKRRRWLGLMGLDEDEIEDHIKNDPPADVDEEQQQLDAVEGIKALNDAIRGHS